MENTRILYVFEGNGQVAGRNVPQHSLVILGADGSAVDFIAGKEGARLIVVGGKPIHEPIVRYGSFVINTREQIDQAMKDFQSDSFVRDRAWIKRDKQIN